MARLSCLLVYLLVCVTGSRGQWPLGEGFYTGMNQMVRNLNNMAANMQNNMAVNMQAMQEQMARQRQAIIADGRRRAQVIRRFGPGGRTFTTSDGGTGYTYNSPDGSYNMFSFSSNSPSSGYIYHSGPDGTYFRNW